MLRIGRGSQTAKLVSILLLCVCVPLLVVTFRVAPMHATTTETSSAESGPNQIAPGSSIRDELTAGAKDVFEVSVDPAQLLRFSIDKGDLVLSTALYGPTNVKLLEHVSQDFESVDLSFPIQVAGLYRIELQSHEKSESPRPYELKLQPLTPVTLLNRKDSEARHLVAQAETLRSKWTEMSSRQATKHLDEAALIWVSISDFASASHAALKSGDVYFLLSEFEHASRRYQDAESFAAKAGDWLAKAQALSHLGRLQVHIGKNDLAQAALTEALYLFEQNESNRSVIAANAHAAALSNLAEVSYSKGDFVKCSEQLKSALNLFRGDRKSEAKAHLFRGYIDGSIGKTEKAVAELTQAQQLYHATNDKVGEALAMTILTLRYSRKGDESRANETYRKVIAVFRAAGDRHSEAIALNALGQSHQNLGEYSIALNEYENALRLFEGIGAFDGASVAAFQIATVYADKAHFDQALAYYDRCLKLSRAAGKLRTEAHVLSRIAKIYVAQGKHKQTAAQLRKVLRFFEAIGDIRGLALALNEYGDFLLQTGQTARALDAYQRALPFSEQVGEQGILISTLYNLARANLVSDHPESALVFVQRSLKIIEDLRAKVESPDFRASYFSGVQKHYQLCTEIFMQLDQRHPGEGFAAEALLVNDRGRARLLFDLINESQTNLPDPHAKELLERAQELRALFQIQAEYRLDSSLRRDQEELVEVDKQLTQLRADYQEVQAQLRQQNPRLFSVQQFAPLTLQKIQNELRDRHTMLLQYALGEKQSYLWAITSDSFGDYELPPRKDLEDAAHEFYELITARQGIDGPLESDYQATVETADKALSQKANNLSQMLLGPVAEKLENRRLVVIMEGALQYIPFAALPVPGAQTISPGSMSKNLLLETNEIVRLPSVSTLLAIRGVQKHTSSPRKLVAVIADPVFSDSDERVQSAPLSTQAVLAATDDKQNQAGQTPDTLSVNDRLARLAYAAEEADEISAVAPWGTTLVAKGFDATRETVMSSDVGQYQIIHFATHGFLDPKRPELSGIVLTSVDQSGGKTNGFMPLHDIYNLNLSAKLTVLSACQTALGKETKGEGLIGLTHSFLSAGSKSVVASLWKVDDRATAVLMADFYEGMLQKGMSPSAALQSAQLKMMHNKQWSAPYYWAGFVLQGEYANSITVDRHAWLRVTLVLFFLLILIAATLLFLQKRKRRNSLRQFT